MSRRNADVESTRLALGCAESLLVARAKFTAAIPMSKLGAEQLATMYGIRMTAYTAQGFSREEAMALIVAEIGAPR